MGKMDEENGKSYDLQDYLSYRESLDSSMEQTELKSRKFYNDSYVHAAMVADAIIRLATRGHLPIKMYCGEFSIFRDKFSEKINQLKIEIEPRNNAELHEKWLNFNPHKDLIDSFKSYLDNENADFQLIVERDISDIKNERIWDVVGKGLGDKKVTISKISGTAGLSHFIVSGNSYRKESSDKEKTAICCFDDATTAGLLSANFETLKSKAVKCFDV